MSIISIERKVLDKNDTIAEENKKHFQSKKNFVINMLSSPGSGKTSLVERTIAHLKETKRLSVIEGDVQTDLDAQRIDSFGVPVVQIVTNGGCHLDASLIRDSLSKLDTTNSDIVIIENVGNLVCPAGYNLGEDLKVVVISVTEGDDKPLKYPAAFRNAQVLVVNKIDLLPYLTCSIEELIKNALQINPQLKIFKTSCTSDEGISDWSNWLNDKTQV